MHPVHRWLSITLLVLAGTSASGQERGKPWAGQPAIRETNATITQRDRADRGKVRPFRIMREHKGPDRRQLPNDPAAKNGDRFPMPTTAAAADTSTATPLAAQTGSTSFTAATLRDTGAYPPDTMGVVGPTQFVAAVNGRIRTFNKATGTADGVLDVNTDTFFSSVMTSPTSTNFTSDPRIRYNRLSAR